MVLKETERTAIENLRTTGKKLADVVKVGDYVSYTPDTVSNTDTKYTTLISNLETYSGSTANTTSTLTQEGEILKLIAQTKKKMQRGDTQEKIADDLMEEESVIQPIYEAIKQYPDKTKEEIYKMLNL